MITVVEQTDGPSGSMDPEVTSKLDPKKFILGLAARIHRENEEERSKYQGQSAYEMCRRFRGTTLGDKFGYFREGIWTEGRWFQNLHSTNVFQALVKGAEGGIAAADIKLEVTGNQNNSRVRMGVKVLKRVLEIEKVRQWDAVTRKDIFYANILKNNAFIISRFNKSGGTESVPMPIFGNMEYEIGGKAVCNACYHTQEYSQVEGQETTCDKCGGSEFSVVKDPERRQEEKLTGFEKKPAGRVEMVVADGLDVSVDQINGKPSDIKSCSWVEWRYLAQKNILKRYYPHLQLKDGPEWSYQTRLKQGLKRYSDTGSSYPETEYDFTDYEVRQIWLDLSVYEDYVPPEDWKVGNFEFKAGVPLKKTAPDGIVVAVIGQEVAFIDHENKNKRVKASAWLTDGVGFVGIGASAGISIQRKINHLDNMTMEGEARSLKGALLYRSDAVDPTDLEGANTNIPIRPEYGHHDKPLSHATMPLDVSGLKRETLEFLSIQRETMQMVVGVPDVKLGENDTNADKTFGGQALRSRNADQLLVPNLQGVAVMMVGWAYDQGDILQNFMAPEGLLDYGLRWGEEWDRDHVEAFYALDLERDVTITHVQGSEIPETRFEREERLRADIANGFVQMNPELEAKFIQSAGFEDVDPQNTESNRRLAEKRFSGLKEGISDELEALYQELEPGMIDPETGERAMDETGLPVPNPIVVQLSAQMIVSTYTENHEQMIEFWSDKVRSLNSSTSDQSMLLTALCELMVTKHVQGQVMVALQTNNMTAMVQAAGIPPEGENGNGPVGTGSPAQPAQPAR